MCPVTCLQWNQHINPTTFCPNRTERQSWICHELLLNPINKYIPHYMLQACGVSVELKAFWFFFFFLFCWRISCEREDWYCLPHPVKSDVTDAKWCITELCITLRTIRRRNSCVATWIWWKCCLVAKSCSTLYDFMDCSTPGFPVLHYLLEFAQIHVHWVGDTILPSAACFSFCLQSFQSSGSFPVSQLFASGGQRIGVSASASVLPMNIQGWW